MSVGYDGGGVLSKNSIYTVEEALLELTMLLSSLVKTLSACTSAKEPWIVSIWL